MKKRLKIPCRHCGVLHNDRALAELCYELDLKILNSKPNEKTISPTPAPVTPKTGKN